MNIEECVIISKKILSDDKVILSLRSKAISASARSGQFVEIACDETLLRRPFSICGVDREKNLFFVGIGVRGKGTRWLYHRNEGDKLSVLGPLGNHFYIPSSKKCIVVGGGIGVFPLLFLLSELRKSGNRTLAVCGYKTKSDVICAPEFQQLAHEVIFVSECGEMDRCGKASVALDGMDLTDTFVYTCGPFPMMREISSIVDSKAARCQVSLEERMGCGTGVCLVCVCKIKSDSDPEGYEYKRCCKEGPVFEASEVIWE